MHIHKTGKQNAALKEKYVLPFCGENFRRNFGNAPIQNANIPRAQRFIRENPRAFEHTAHVLHLISCIKKRFAARQS